MLTHEETLDVARVVDASLQLRLLVEIVDSDLRSLSGSLKIRRIVNNARKEPSSFPYIVSIGRTAVDAYGSILQMTDRSSVAELEGEEEVQL